MSKADFVVSSFPPIIVTTNDICNNCIHLDPLLPSGTYIDVVLDVRAENSTQNNGDVPNEEKMSDITLSKLQIQKKITPMRLVNLDRSKWLPEKWRFETKVHTNGATTGIVNRYYIEPVSRGKFRSENLVDNFMKTGGKRKKPKNNINGDDATSSEVKTK
uniref:Putative ovule protein n=1 Tax=Solanum chacoense TaxID=4108 RepID=A0A0V0HNB2_SOLCH